MNSTRPASTALAFFLLTVTLTGAATAQTHPPCDYLIVTTEALAPAFEELAFYRTETGFTVDLVTLEDVLAETPPLEDDAATLRSYLATRHDESGTEFVLLGGDLTRIPGRICYKRYSPELERYYPSDLYFACYDGTWNADGDSLYAEPGEDETDLDPEVALGRVPVADLGEAEAFVAKVEAYEQNQSGHQFQALLAGAVLHPYPWVEGEPALIDGGTFCEVIVPSLESLPLSVSATRLYQNHTAFDGAEPLTAAAMIDSLGSGRFGLVDLIGHGNATTFDPGDEYVHAADMASLANGDDLTIAVCMFTDMASFDADDGFLTAGLVNPDGGFVAGISNSALTYIYPAGSFHEQLYLSLGALEQPRLGLAWQDVQREMMEPGGSAFDFTQTITTLLGDPALLVWPAEPVQTEDPETPEDLPVITAKLTLEPCYPNPFNPQTTIAYTLGFDAPVSLSIFDMRGRFVRELVHADQETGRHAAVWDGTDRTGQAMPSGMYLYRVTAGQQVRSGRMMLAK